MHFDDTTRHAPSRCPSCDYEVDASSGEGSPAAGDCTICLRCGALSIFSGDLTLRRPSVEEIAEIESDFETKQNLDRIRTGIEKTAQAIYGGTPQSALERWRESMKAKMRA